MGTPECTSRHVCDAFGSGREVLAQAKATREQQAAIEAALDGADTRGFQSATIAGNLVGPIILNGVIPAATISVYNDLAVPVINERR